VNSCMQDLRAGNCPRKLHASKAFGTTEHMWYVIHAKDRPESLAQRLSARPAHVERLKELNRLGRLLTAGPIPAIDSEDPGPAGYSGSLVIADFADISAAKAWARNDPYFAAGVYEDVDVLPFKRVLPL